MLCFCLWLCLCGELYCHGCVHLFGSHTQKETPCSAFCVLCAQPWRTSRICCQSMRETADDLLTSLDQALLVQVAFTGSTEVGKLIMAQAAQNLVPVTLELGGVSAG